MLRNEFNEAIKYFESVIRQEGDKNKHKWVNDLKGLTGSYLYADGIFEDINFFLQYLKGRSILDFGTGCGLTALLCAHLGYEVKGVDIDHFFEQGESREYFKEMASDQVSLWENFTKKYPNLEFKHYKKQITYPDNLFDAVIAYAVIEHVLDEQISYVMQELKRVLKPQGLLFIAKLPRKLSYLEHFAKILKLGHHWRLYADNEIRDLLLKNDFQILKTDFTDMLPAYPLNFTNRLYPLLKSADGLLLRSPFKYFAHDIRIICRNIK